MLELFNGNVFDSECDAVIVPITTSRNISTSLLKSLKEKDIRLNLEGHFFKLGQVTFVQNVGNSSIKYVVFACTGDEIKSTYSTIRTIGRNIGLEVSKMSSITKIATPIFEISAEGLNHYSLSRNILHCSFYETADSTKQLKFYTTDKDVYTFLFNKTYDLATSSANLVIISEINRVLATDTIRTIMYEKGFYYELAQLKFHEFLAFKPDDESFFSSLWDEFKFSRLKFRKFLLTIDQASEKYRFLRLCGELISYLDYHAYSKNIWNQYEDKRVLARSGVTQTNWLRNLIKFKEADNDIEIVKATSISNALKYLYDPQSNMTMLSEDHRRMVFKSILSENYEGGKALSILFNYFEKLGIKCRNRINDSVLYTRILYLPFIKPIWFIGKDESDDSIVVTGTDEVNYSRLMQLISDCLMSESTILDIGKCGLKDLSVIPDLFECTHIETLILSNEWGEYDNGNWIRKVSSNTGANNVIHFLPHEMTKLSKLKVLICGGDWKNKKSVKLNTAQWGIKDISILSTLQDLRVLNVSNNEIENVGDLTKLNRLEKLYLNNNLISSFPDISGLSHLEEVYLSNNRLANIDFLKGLPFVKTIDLHSNVITDLTPIKWLISRLGVVDGKWSTNTITISSTYLRIPTPEIVSQGKEKILSYFELLEREQSISIVPHVNRDIKLIVVGNSNVGKSTLISWLKNKKVNTDIGTTHWMTVDMWQENYKDKEYTIRIFDFGGQEYYHETHHLFFTNKTAYIVLWDQESNYFDEIEIEQKHQDKRIRSSLVQTFPVEYWLDSIKYHSEQKRKSESERAIEVLLNERDASIFESIKLGDNWINHVISASEELRSVIEPMLQFKAEDNILVIQNKIDANGSRNFINQKGIQDNYKGIYEFLSISVLKEMRLESFYNLLFEVLDSMSIVGAEYPGTWGYIKQKIEADKFVTPFSIEGFKNYCNQVIKEMPEVKGKGEDLVQRILFNSQDTESFAQYLNDIGVVLYYLDNIKLRDKVFVNQEWVLDNIYNTLVDLNKSNGEFNADDVLKSLNKNDFDNDAKNTIDLMLHFKIIFEHPKKENTYIAPLYLPKDPLQSINLFTHLFSRPIYRFKYKSFIYKNVILEIFHRYGKNAIRESYKGDLYYYWKNGLIVKDDASEEVIMIKFFQGTKLEQNNYIDVYVLKETSDDLFLTQIVEDIENINKDIECSKCVTVNGIDFIPLDVIHQNEEQENWIFHFENKYFKLVDFKNYFKKPIKMKKVFISYSKQDFGLVKKFIEHLSALQLDGKVSHWYCSELEAGSEWNYEIQKHFDESDIVCFMISPNFMKTQYIHEHEIANAFEKKKKNNGFKIIPIILDFCRWATTKNDLTQFTALPYTAKPVVDFVNENMAWYIIQECLRLMIDEDLDPKGSDFYSQQKLPSDVLKIYERIVDGKVDRH